MKFIHISDIHFGKTYKNRDVNISKLLINEQRNAFEEMIQIAIANKVEGVLIAGDMFDTNKVSLSDEQFVCKELEKLAEVGIHVFYCSGNHDYTNTESSIRKLKCLEHVHTFFDDNYSAVVIESKYRVVSCGHDNKHEMRDLISDFPKFSDDLPTIGLGHSMIASALSDGSEGAYMASSVEAISQSGYDYWALGHIHKSGKVHTSIDCYYAGSLSGLSSKETGPKGGLIVEFVNERLQAVKFVEFSKVQWHNVELDCSSVESSINRMNDLYEFIFESIQESIKGIPNNKRLFVTVDLMGKTHLSIDAINADRVNEMEIQLVQDTRLSYVKIKMGLTQNIDVNKMMNEEGLLKELTLNMKDTERLSGLIDILMEDQLFKVEAMTDKRAYIKSILEENYEKLIGYILGENYGDQ